MIEKYYKNEQAENCKKGDYKILILSMEQVFSKLDSNGDIFTDISPKQAFICFTLRNCLETINISDLLDLEYLGICPHMLNCFIIPREVFY